MRNTPAPGALDRDRECRAVYEAAFQELYRSLRSVRVVVDPVTPLTWTPAEIRNRLPELKPETLADYAGQSGTATLPPNLDLGRPIEWFGRADWDRLDPPGSWEAFDARFPDTRGWFVFSPVGFSAARSEAVVHIQRRGGPRDAEGTLLILDRLGSRWLVRRKVITTVS